MVLIIIAAFNIKYALISIIVHFLRLLYCIFDEIKILQLKYLQVIGIAINYWYSRKCIMNYDHTLNKLN